MLRAFLAARKEKIHCSLRCKLTLSLLALCLIVLAVATAVHIYFNISAQRKTLAAEQQLQARRAGFEVQDFIIDRLVLLSGAAAVSDLSAAPDGPRRLVLDRLLGHESSFRQLFYFDAQKRLLAHSSRLSRRASAPPASSDLGRILSGVAKTDEFVSAIRIDGYTHEPLVYLAVPVRNVFGDLSGALVAEINLKFMWNLVGDIHVGTDSNAFVVDRNGILLAYSDVSRVLKSESVMNLAEVRRFAANTDSETDPARAMLARGIEGKLVVTTHAPLGLPDWAVVTETPVAEAYAAVFETTTAMLVVLLLSFALAVWLSIKLAAKVTKPIIALKDAALLLGQGHFDTRVQTDTRDELGSLADSFNSMASALQRSTTSIEALNAEIVERNRAEWALVESEARFRDIVNTTGDWLWEIDAAGNFTYSSPMSEKILGYRMEELLGRPVFSSVAAADAPDLQKAMGDIMGRKVSFNDFQSRHLHKNGQIKILSTSGLPRLNADGSLKGYRGVCRDITARALAEAALQESEARFRDIASTSGDWLWEVDSSARYTYCSPMVEKILGYNPEELLGKPFCGSCIEDEYEGMKQRVESALAKKVSFKNVRSRHRHKDGRVVILETSGLPLLNPDGSLRGYRGVDRDVTERERAAEALRESERRFNDVASHTGDWLWETDPDGKFTYNSPMVEKIIGYKPEDLLGVSFFGLFPIDEKEEQQRKAGSGIRRREHFRNFTHKNIHKDGRQVILETSGLPRFDSLGKFLGYRGVHRDVTARHRAEEALRVSEKRFRDIAENSGEWIWEIDADGNYTYNSPVLEKILGYRPEELLGRSFCETFVPEERESVRKAVEAVFARKESFRSFLNRNLHKDGHVVILETSALPLLDAEGRLLGYRGVDRDITLRHHAEEALRASEKRFRDIAENSGEWFWECDVNAVCTYSSPVSLQILGYTAEELLGSRIGSKMHPDDIPKFHELMARLISTPAPFRNLSIREIHKSGRELIVEASGVPLFGPDGKLSGYRGLIRDVTEHRRAQEALAQEKERLFVTLHSIGDAVIAVDGKGNVNLMNQVAADLTGWTEAEALDLPLTKVFKIFNGRTRVACENPVDKVMRTGAMVALANHTMLLSRNGKEYAIADSGAPIFNKDGSIGGVILVFRDVTEDHKIREDLLLRNAALDSAQHGVLVLGFDDTNLYFNRAIQDMFGFEDDPEGFRTIPTTSLVDQATYESILSSVKTNGRWVGEVSAHKKDGSPILVQMTASLVINEDGVAVAMVGIMYDMTEQRRQEQKMRQLEVEKLASEEASRAKTIFLANMSHELRTPLTAVLTSASMLLEGMLGRFNKKQLEYLSNIQDGGRHLLNIINDILDMSKVEAGRAEVEREQVELKPQLDDILGMFHVPMAQAGVKLVKTLALPEGCKFAVDRRKLKQVLINLLANAVKFTARGGSVTLEARLLAPAHLPESAQEQARRLAPAASEFLFLAVRDTGIGIRAEDMRKLFQPFSQLDEGHSRNFGGTGLGLALVRKLVELHGGFIWAESKFGKGSSFCFVIPAAAAPAELPEKTR